MSFFVATKVVKDEVIRVRVTSEQKKLKIIAKEKNKTISEILSVATENEIKKFEEQAKYLDEMNKRFVATEKKIQELKIKMATKKNNKKSFWGKKR